MARIYKGSKAGGICRNKERIYKYAWNRCIQLPEKTGLE